MRALSRLLIASLLAPPLLYAGAVALLYVHQRKVLYNPVPRGNLDVATMPLPDSKAAVLVSIHPHEGKKAVVYFGGKSEDVSRNVPALAEAFPDCAIYALHYRGFGGSGGTPTETDIIADAFALYDTVHKRHPDIILVGRSLGSGVAIQVAAQRRCRRLVMVTPYDSIADVAATHFRAFPARWIVQDRYQSWLVAPRIRTPTTVITAEFDAVIPLSHTQRLLTHFAPGIAHVVMLAGEDHGSFLYKPAYFEALRSVGPRVRMARQRRVPVAKLAPVRRPVAAVAPEPEPEPGPVPPVAVSA
jgi:pimeloyl-ACP methyl ester carboxylesterase